MRAIALAAVLFLVAVTAGYGSSSGAVRVSGAATQSGGGQGYLRAVSCGAPGDCAAGGSYVRSGGGQAFVVSERKGRWGKPIDVPGIGVPSEVDAISCAAAGECAAAGDTFVVNETNGSWGKAIEVPGLATLNTGGEAKVTSISCAAAGECAAGGFYFDASTGLQPFVVSETNGSWGTAIEVPGTATLNTGHDAEVNSISCAAAGECAAGGFYFEDNGHMQAFVVTETNGTWGIAIEVPGTAALNTGDGAQVTSISCAAVGECAAGGFYSDGSDSSGEGYHQAFVVSETNGTWGNAIEVPGTAALNISRQAEVDSVSCPSVGACAAGGSYLGAAPGSAFGVGFEAFVVSEKNGTWDTAIEVPGTATVNTGGGAWVASISCAAAGECAAGGHYSEASGNAPAFVVNETNGSWGNQLTVGGVPFNSSQRGVESISCAAPGSCVGGGWYDDRSGQPRAYVVGETNGSWGKAMQVRLPVCVVPNLYGSGVGEANTMLTHAHCGFGKVTNVYADSKPGRVVAQHPLPGKILIPGAPVAFSVSKGKKP